MTFRKNLFVLLSSVFVTIIGALLMRLGIAAIVDFVTLVIPTVVAALLIEDLWDKLLERREKLTWQYFIGELFVTGSILTWIWASTSVTVKQMVIRLVVTFLLGVFGYIWFKFSYFPSTQSAEGREQLRWEKYQKKILEAADRDEAFRLLSYALRFRLLDDNLSGCLDFDRPIGVYQEQVLTYEELISAEDDGTDSLQVIQSAAHEYLAKLIDGLPE